MDRNYSQCIQLLSLISIHKYPQGHNYYYEWLYISLLPREVLTDITTYYARPWNERDQFSTQSYAQSSPIAVSRVVARYWCILPTFSRSRWQFLRVRFFIEYQGWPNDLNHWFLFFMIFDFKKDFYIQNDFLKAVCDGYFEKLIFFSQQSQIFGENIMKTLLISVFTASWWNWKFIKYLQNLIFIPKA